MTPVISIVYTVRKIVVTPNMYQSDYVYALNVAFTQLHEAGLLSTIGIESVDEFHKAARCAKETDGTFTVTIP